MSSSPGPVVNILGQIAYHFNEISPFIPTFIILILAAIFPIYIGAHASLSRPSTAAKSSKKSSKKSRSPSDKRMEGLTPIDALLYPLMTGAMLAGLYYLIKWLQDPALLNKILNYYLTAFGTFAVWQLVRDSMVFGTGLVFPTKYSLGKKIYSVDERKQKFVAVGDAVISESSVRTSPLPGLLSMIPLPPWVCKICWTIRQQYTQPAALIEIFAKDMGQTVLNLDMNTVVASIVSLGAVLYYNLVDRPWWLTNVFGFSFSYSILQLLSPTTFWTGTLILTSLFFYDIYFVFYTPMMIEVATKLDIPVKLLIPKPGDPNHPEKQALTLLGLGDIALPGIMIGLALRFDLYMHYLRKQTIKTPPKTTGDKSDNSSETVVKAEYINATGNWGDRFWLDSTARKLEGGSFAKPYFTSSMIGYIIGMLVTETIMHIAKHGQPALLYLVPSVLGSLWLTAAVRGEVKYMWEYTEDEEAEKNANKTKVLKELDSAADGSKQTSAEKGSDKVTELPDTPSGSALGETSTSDGSSKNQTLEEDRRIFYITITLPETAEKDEGQDKKEKSIEGSLKSKQKAVAVDTQSSDPDSSFVEVERVE